MLLFPLFWVGGMEILQKLRTYLLCLYVQWDKIEWSLETDVDTHFNVSCKFNLCLKQSGFVWLNISEFKKSP